MEQFKYELKELLNMGCVVAFSNSADQDGDHIVCSVQHKDKEGNIKQAALAFSMKDDSRRQVSELPNLLKTFRYQLTTKDS